RRTARHPAPRPRPAGREGLTSTHIPPHRRAPHTPHMPPHPPPLPTGVTRGPAGEPLQLQRLLRVARGSGPRAAPVGGIAQLNNETPGSRLPAPRSRYAPRPPHPPLLPTGVTRGPVGEPLQRQYLRRTARGSGP